MTPHPRSSTPTTGLRAALATVACGTLTWLLGLAGQALLDAAPARPGVAPMGMPLEGLVGLVVVTSGVGAGVVLTTGCLLLTASVIGPARWAHALGAAAGRLTPRVLRTSVAVGLGAALGVLGTSGPATATEIDLGWAVTTETTSSPTISAPAPTAVPTATVAAPPTSVPAPATAASAVTGATGATTETTPTAAPVRVVAGDSLWSIAAAHLDPGASDAQIAAAWPQWYAANRSTIGSDPDLIVPGQRLVVPSTAPAGQETS